MLLVKKWNLNFLFKISKMMTLFENKGWEKWAISQSSKFQAAMPQLSGFKEVWKHVYCAARDKNLPNTPAESQAWSMP